MPSQKKKLLLFGSILTIAIFAFTVWAQTPEEERKALEEQLKTLDEQSAKLENDIKATQKEKQTLQNQIRTLQNKIKKLGVEIRQGNLMIQDLKLQIKETETTIDKTTIKLDKTRAELKDLLRVLYQENRKGNLEIFLAENSLSEFFGNLANLETLNLKISQSLGRVKSLKASLQEEKSSLDKEKGDLQTVVGMQTLQKQASEDNKKQQETILTETKGKEALYQKYLEENKKKAAQIRSRIFELIGISQAPTFGQAYEIAKFVSKSTGVRPAFLLAVITQESNLGKNVGQCNCPSGQYCKYPELGWKEVMKESRDWQPFLQITQELGRDPNATPVSCPMYLNGRRVGYGGAMGPAQFIPSIWVNYQPRVEEISGHKPADPWNINDAFLAAALYLKDFGADAQTYNNEWRAAMIYFSGGTKSRFRFYGDSVMNIAKGLQDDIATIEKQLGIKNTTRE